MKTVDYETMKTTEVVILPAIKAAVNDLALS